LPRPIHNHAFVGIGDSYWILGGELGGDPQYSQVVRITPPSTIQDVGNLSQVFFFWRLI
jgi:hypothetical protein